MAPALLVIRSSGGLAPPSDHFNTMMYARMAEERAISFVDAAMERARSAVILEIITAIAVVAVLLYVMFGPSN
jgi:hypothetical protein